MHDYHPFNRFELPLSCDPRANVCSVCRSRARDPKENCRPMRSCALAQCLRVCRQLFIMLLLKHQQGDAMSRAVFFILFLFTFLTFLALKSQTISILF